MLSKTTIYITIHQSETLMFTFHPQMTALQLQQLIKASNFLSSKVTHFTSNTQSLTFLLSQSRNLITDYLLTSTSYPLSKICSLQQKYRLFYRSLYDISSPDLLQKHNKNQKEVQKALVLNLQIVSQQNQIEKQTSLIYYQNLNDKKKCLSKEVDEKIIKFQTEIMINKEKNRFFQRIKLRKQTLTTYHHFQNLMKIRQKLIQLTKNRSNIFEQLVNTCQDKQNLIFQLNYVPTIRITEILKYNLQKQQKKRIIEKVVAFTHYLICNGFQKFFFKLFQQTKIPTFLDEITIDFNQNLRVSDVRIILEHDEKFQFQMKKDELKNLQMYIQTYLSKIHSSNIQAQGIVMAEEVYIQLFSSKSYKFKLITLDNYIPQCKFFLWKASQFQKICSTLRNEGTTIKKKTIQDAPKKRIKSQKTKVKYGILQVQAYRREDKSTKKQNRSFV